MRFTLRTAALAVGMAAAVVLFRTAPVSAQDKEKKATAPFVGGTEVFRAENELKKNDPKDKVRTDSAAHVYTYFMRKGKTYLIECNSKEIDSYLRLEDADGKQLAFDDDGGGYPNARIVFKCPKTDTYKIVATTYGKGAEGHEFGNYGTYTLTIKTATKGLAFRAGKAEVQGMLAATDARDTVRQQMYCKIYPIEFKAGKTYQIDMVSGAVDSYLRLEDANKQQLAFDDDGGGFPNARIVFNCQTTGTYRIICTTFAPNTTGPFTLTVRRQ